MAATAVHSPDDQIKASTCVHVYIHVHVQCTCTIVYTVWQNKCNKSSPGCIGLDGSVTESLHFTARPAASTSSRLSCSPKRLSERVWPARLRSTEQEIYMQYYVYIHTCTYMYIHVNEPICVFYGVFYA